MNLKLCMHLSVAVISFLLSVPLYHLVKDWHSIGCFFPDNLHGPLLHNKLDVPGLVI